MNSITAFLGNILKSGVFKLGGFEDQASDAFNGSAGHEYVYGATSGSNKEFWKDAILILAKIADWLIPVIMIIIGMVGAIYFTVVGIRYAKAENEEHKNEAKKKLINAGIGVGISLLIMIALLLVLSNADAIANFVGKAQTSEG